MLVRTITDIQCNSTIRSNGGSVCALFQFKTIQADVDARHSKSACEFNIVCKIVTTTCRHSLQICLSGNRRPRYILTSSRVVADIAMRATANGVFMRIRDLLHRHDLIGVAHGDATAGGELGIAGKVAVAGGEERIDTAGRAVFHSIYAADIAACGKCAVGRKTVSVAHNNDLTCAGNVNALREYAVAHIPRSVNTTHGGNFTCARD